jgi:hypothetical protein
VEGRTSNKSTDETTVWQMMLRATRKNLTGSSKERIHILQWPKQQRANHAYWLHYGQIYYNTCQELRYLTSITVTSPM